MEKKFNVIKVIRPHKAKALEPIEVAKEVDYSTAILALSEQYELNICDITADVSPIDYMEDLPWFIVDKPNVSIYITIEESFYSKLACSINPNQNRYNYCVN
jgi:hypothetical protein